MGEEGDREKRGGRVGGVGWGGVFLEFFFFFWGGGARPHRKKIIFTLRRMKGIVEMVLTVAN